PTTLHLHSLHDLFRSPRSPRPPANQRARALDTRTQQLVLHAQFANPLHCRGELTAHRIRLALLQRAIQRRFRPLTPALELVERRSEEHTSELQSTDQH